MRSYLNLVIPTSTNKSQINHTLIHDIIILRKDCARCSGFNHTSQNCAPRKFSKVRQVFGQPCQHSFIPLHPPSPSLSLLVVIDTHTHPDTRTISAPATDIITVLFHIRVYNTREAHTYIPAHATRKRKGIRRSIREREYISGAHAGSVNGAWRRARANARQVVMATRRQGPTVTSARRNGSAARTDNILASEILCAVGHIALSEFLEDFSHVCGRG